MKFIKNLSEKEKALVAKKEMKLADKVEVEHYDPKKLSKKNARKVKKLEKKQAKIDKIRSKNDLVVYRNNRRKKVKKTILTLFFLALFVFAALTTLGMLIDYGKITGQAAETIEKYLGYVKPFGQGGAVRTFAKDITLKIFHFFDDLLGLKK